MAREGTRRRAGSFEVISNESDPDDGGDVLLSDHLDTGPDTGEQTGPDATAGKAAEVNVQDDAGPPGTDLDDDPDEADDGLELSPAARRAAEKARRAKERARRAAQEARRLERESETLAARESAGEVVVQGDQRFDPNAPGFVVGTTLTILAAMMLVFAADLLVIGHIRHARDQQTAFSDLRVDLANGTAVVNQTLDGTTLAPMGTALGVLEIPQIGVREVFFEGTTSGVLMSGPGHRRDTPMPGQAGTSVIMGRKAGFGGPFNYLDQLQVGTVFWVWTGQGRSAYRVTGVRRAGDPQPAALAAGQGRLTLVTAAGDDYMPTGTVRVDASLATQALPAGPRPLTAAALPIDERALRSEPSAWVTIVLAALAVSGVAMIAMWMRLRWGRWQTWVATAPLLLAAGVALSEQAARLLPNLL